MRPYSAIVHGVFGVKVLHFSVYCANRVLACQQAARSGLQGVATVCRQQAQGLLWRMEQEAYRNISPVKG